MTTPTIAVIDDDSDLLDLLNILFADNGWAMVPFTDGRMALNALAVTPPSVIMLDLWLGESRNGWDILADLRKVPSLQSTPVIVCSGAVDSLEDKEELLREHRVTILAKPFDIDHLIHMVEAEYEDGTGKDMQVAVAAAAS